MINLLKKYILPFIIGVVSLILLILIATFLFYFFTWYTIIILIIVMLVIRMCWGLGKDLINYFKIKI